MSDHSPKRIMVAPLDWGLGHATRCMPVIDALLARGVEVVLASSGSALALLKGHYPDLEAVELPGCELRFSAGKSQVGMMARQIPGLVRMLRREHQWLRAYVKKHHLDAVISDHRLGMWHPEIESVLLAHQIAIQAPSGLKGLSPILFKLHWQYMKRFDQLWVPDVEGEDNLTGKLVPRQVRSMESVRFIGPLSHLAAYEDNGTTEWPSSIAVLIILSGLEPQRSLLEEKLRKEVENLDQDVIMVQGLSGKIRRTKTGKLTTISFLGSNDLAILCRRADVVISRIGYSSLMDVSALGKQRLLFIPTPGQTEQIYLAQRIMKQKKAFVQQQDKLDLGQAFEQFSSFTGFPGSHSSDKLLKNGLDKLLARIVTDNS